MTSNCDNCTRSITKAKPGLECNRCEKTVHLNSLCSGLTKKQITALKATENLEWTCRACQNNSVGRRSIIIPSDEDEEDDEESEKPDMKICLKKLTTDISKEVENAIKREMKDITHTIQFYSDKMDDFLKKIETMQGNKNNLQKKNTELTNRNNFLEVRVGAMEQRIQEFEQRKLRKYIEIHHMPTKSGEDLQNLVSKIAEKINQNPSDVKDIKRLPERNGRPGPIQLKLKTEQTQIDWLTACKSKIPKIFASDICINMSKSTNSLFICEALTQYNKSLLFNTKQELKDSFKYIWIKKGVLRVKKEGENTKTHIIRSLEDIKRIKATSL